MKSSGIGGQAVLEGIMMRNGGKYAVAVRKPDKEIEIDIKEHRGLTEKHKFLNVPFIRGVFKFAESLSVGIKTLTYSASFIEDEEEPEKPVSKRTEDILMALTVCFSVVFSIGLFIVLPFLVGEFFRKILEINSNTIIAIMEGLARILIFMLYLILISKMKDIQRTFMYHGAEHKCINCIEQGLELNVENVRKSSRLHKRCGTSFLLFVVVISIISFILVSAIIPEASSGWLKLVVRLALIPIIAGISFEILRLAGNSDGKIIGLISKPGIWLQRLTTREPEDDMIEVGIASVEAIYDWKAYLKENFGKEFKEADSTIEVSGDSDDV
ncbi:MAG: DUF1385 domain-containing protein [Lachnospiraceae bacterium]|nr:DUF1385 domain-containing protein [Lachnospiraceae bacterium]MBQ6814240.1 DUF1385 domain-containing protein [Lachnospiraceae bacterium]